VNKLLDNVNQLLLIFIVTVFSIITSYIADIAKSTQTLSLSVQELNIRMGQTTDLLKDHEFRIRAVENNTQKRR